MVNSQGRFIWYELITTDMKAAKAFYANVVGWDIRDVSPPPMAYSLFSADGASVSGLMSLPEDAAKMGAKPCWIGYVGVDDVAATADRIKQLGGTVHVPPQDIPDTSRFSIVADSQTVTFGVFKWLITGRGQPAEPDAPGHVGWHELLAADGETAFAFYSEIFGWGRAGTNIGATGRYQLFSAAGQMIGGIFTKPPQAPTPIWLYYFNIGDIDAAAKRVTTGNGQILMGPVEMPDGKWIIQCTDPQGAMFALMGRRKQKDVGFFERLSSRVPSDVRFGPRK